MSTSDYAIFGALIFVSLLASCCVLWILIVGVKSKPVKPWKLCGYHLASYQGRFEVTEVDSDYCVFCKDFKSSRRKSRKLKLVKGDESAQLNSKGNDNGI